MDDLNKLLSTQSKFHQDNEWDDFSYFAFTKLGYSLYDKEVRKEFIPWLFNADNFFKAFVEWRNSL